MSFDPKTLLAPPSPLFPLVGLALGASLTSEGHRLLGATAGILAGMLVNVSTSSIMQQADNTKLSGGKDFHASLGAELLKAAMGDKPEPASTVQVASGPVMYRLRGVG